MRAPITPERFGCGLKLQFDELLEIRQALQRNHCEDAAVLHLGPPDIMESIDKIFDVGCGPEVFARLAISHASADLICSGAEPSALSACFEFGPFAEPSQRAALSSALFAEAEARKLLLGKCHSTFGPSTALTLAVSGPRVHRLSGKMETSNIYLSRPLGGFRNLYGAVLQGADFGTELEFLSADQRGVLDSYPLMGFCTDVSGYGLAGALWELATTTRSSVRVELNGTCFLPSLDQTFPCLTASLGAYEIRDLSETMSALVNGRELCGPALFCCQPEDEAQVFQRFFQAGMASPLGIGVVAPGPARVEVAGC